MADSVTHIINQALRRVGYPVPIGYMYEGSVAARAALDIYGQCRDDLLRSFDWPFARQTLVMTLLKTAPPGGYGTTTWTTAYPPMPWIYEYVYPSNCLEMRVVRPTSILIPEYDPQPNQFVIADDPSVTPSKVVLTNLGAAVAVYTGQITDVTQWEPNFTEAMVEALGRRLGEALGVSQDNLKAQFQVEKMAEESADRKRG